MVHLTKSPMAFKCFFHNLVPIATDFKTQPNRQIYADRYYCYPVFVALLLTCISAWHVMRTDWLVGLVNALVYITTFTLCNAFNGLCSWFMSLLVDFWSSEKKLLGHSETALPCVLGTCTWLEFWRLGLRLILDARHALSRRYSTIL